MRSDIDKDLEQTVVYTDNIVSVFRAFIKVGAKVVYSVEWLDNGLDKPQPEVETALFFQSVQINCGTHATSCLVGTVEFL